jgi:multidrug resistance efflux pump
MGLLRKTASLSTLGAVKYTSRREAQTKAASAQARVAREEVKQLKAQRKQETDQRKQETDQRKQETDQRWEEILAAFEAGEVTWDDLSRMQKMQMPITYQIKCKAAQRRQTAG